MDAKAVIWDVDGTLLDSYRIMVPVLSQILAEFGVIKAESEIHRSIIKGSVRELLERTERETGIPFARLHVRYQSESRARDGEIKPIQGAAQILERLFDRGVLNFVYTHRGASTETVLQNAGMLRFFTEVLTSQSGFPRKPDPQAIRYLLRKYSLPPERTFYVGDRGIDVECARNAGVKSVLYLPPASHASPSGIEDFTVSDLLEIQNIVR